MPQSTRKTGYLQNAALAPLAAVPFNLALCAGQSAVAQENSSDTDEIVVVGEKIYDFKSASSGTKMNMALKDTPQAIKVITADVIQAANIRNFQDVYKVDASGGTSHAIDSFPRNYYRGFRQQGDNSIKVDGYRFTADLDLDLSTFERFEIVKGPTSTLYGQNTIGGTLNAVSKRPGDDFAMVVSGEIGTQSRYRGELDVTGPLSADGRWTYRLIGVYEDLGSFLDFAESNVAVISPMVEFQPDDNTSFLLRFNYQHHDDVPHWGSPFVQVDDGEPGELALADIPRSQFYGMPWNEAERDVFIGQLSADHVFDNGWTVRSNVQYSKVKKFVKAFANGFSQSNGDEIFSSIYAEDIDDDVFSGEVNLFGDVEAFGREHTLFVGVDYSKKEETGLEAELEPGNTTPFNIFNPDYSLIPEPASLDDFDELINIVDENTQFGVTAQALLRPTDALTLLVGGRYSFSKQLSKETGGEGSVADALAAPFEVTIDNVSFENFTLQTGLTYALTEDLNFYFQYGETFVPGFVRAFPDQLIDPEEGRNYEVGFKGDWGDNVSYSLALFDMRRTNIADPDPMNNGFFIPLGVQRSRGIELDVTGEVLPNLNVIGSVAVLDAEFVEGQFTGLQPPNAPEFGLSLFANYLVTTGPLAGFGVGGGIVHKDGLRTFAQFSNNFEFDFGAFTEVDAQISYDLEDWSFVLSGTNLTNEKYYTTAFTRLFNGVHVNPERAVIFRVSRFF